MISFKHTQIPLKNTWYTIIALASILPALVLSIWLSDQAHELLLERAMLQEDIYHTELSTRLSLEAERLKTVLYNKSDPISYFLQQKNFHEVQALIQKIGIREPMVNTTTLYDTYAHIILSATHKNHSIAPLSPHSPSFSIPMHHRTFLGSLQKLQDDDDEFIISVPIISHKKIIGVMVSTINIHDFWQSVISSMHKHASNTYLIDARGSLIYAGSKSRYQPNDLLSSHRIVRHLLNNKPWNTQKSFTGFENTQVFAISSIVQGLEWGIISEVPASSISRPIIYELTLLTIIIFMLHIMFAVAGIFLTKHLLKPITNLLVILKRAGKGDYSQQAQPSHYHELNLLTSSFNTMMHDIELREKTLKRIYLAIDHAGDSVIITNNHGIIEYVNAAFCQISAYTQEEALGKTSGFLSNSGTQPSSFYQHMWAKINAGEKWEGELVNRRKDGTLYPIFMSISPVFDHGILTHFIAIQKDMSEQKSMEEDLRQAQKMESIGVLVGGIAHDFNNILAGITGNMYLAKKRIKQNRLQESLHKISQIEALSQQAAGMIAQLLAFARKDMVNMHVLPLQAFMQDALKLVRVTVPENIQLLSHIPEESLMIRGDTSQLQQILLNLLNNACDAVEKSPEPSIHLQLSQYISDATFRQQYPDISEENFAHLTVRDNGHGIPQKYIDKLFDPFFTTKEVGKGTGLGLSMVYGAVQSHHGIIRISSSADMGTTFHLYFPIVDEEQDQEETSIEILEPTQADGEMILLADDEAYVRDIMSEVLESLGYRVLLAEDGLQAKTLFNEHQHDISLVILDAVMPHGGGYDLAKGMRDLKPTLGVIFVTGYDKSQVLGSEKQIEGSEILTKPVDFEELNQHIKKILKATNKPIEHPQV